MDFDVRQKMITPEDGVIEGFRNSVGRVFALFVASYLAGIFYPLPETVYHLIIGPQVFDNGSITHTPRFVDWAAVPFIGTLLLSTAFLSFPVYFFCIVCSALDRWDFRKTTILGSAVSFSILFAEDIAPSKEVLLECVIFIASTMVVFRAALWITNLLAEQAAAPDG